MIPSILLMGGGRMGSALLSGWQEAGLAPSVVVDPAMPTFSGDVTVFSSPRVIPVDFRPEAVLLAVKPQVADVALAQIAPRIGKAVVLSIMAGRNVASIAKHLPGTAVVRAMPNTPAAVRRGITVAVAGPGVTTVQCVLCDRLMRAVGEVEWVEDETLLDGVTAVSGSGPAYVFLLAELLEQAAVEQGIPPELAAKLAQQTIIGAATLLDASHGSPAALRRAVTSAGGTTERALDVLLPEWPGLISRAVAAAAARSGELSG